MSDVTYSRKADALSEVDPDGVSERLALAQVHATQAVSRALREIDSKLKYVADKIAEALPQPVERWITWSVEDAGRRAVAVQSIVRFEEDHDRTIVYLSSQETIFIPIPFAQVAMMVGA